MRRFTVVFEKAPDKWAAFVLDLPACVTKGATLEQTPRLVAEAIQFQGGLEAL